MRFVADEGFDMPIVRILRAAGHEVFSILESEPGADDDTILKIANDRSGLLLTCDHDFGELVFRLGRAHQGVVLVRLAGLSEDRKGKLVLDAVTQHGREMPGAFTVITAGVVRIRPGPSSA